ncbi:NUDIX hydrolase [Paenibacillus albiflavus]|nr:NUDIX hydrolase [Paenibacillus albiflavus]
MNKLVIRGVKIVAIYKGKLVIVKQSRAGKNQQTYELPGGRVEHSEELVCGAIRELKEETGLITDHLIELGTYNVPASPITITLYFTNSIVGEANQMLDADEDIEVLYVDIQEAFNKIANATWNDPRLGIGLILARSQRLI